MIGLFLSAGIAMVMPMSHSECLSTLSDDPQAAVYYAEKWESWGGGNEAKHCRALAYVALDAPARGARLLALLADRTENDRGLKTRLLVQTAEAYMAAGDKKSSYAALKSAYKVTPDAADLHMSAATIYATGDHWEGTILALTALEKFAALSADALALRAQAHFNEEQYGKAAEDVSAALTLDPYLVDALVLRGRLKTLRQEPAVITID